MFYINSLGLKLNVHNDSQLIASDVQYPPSVFMLKIVQRGKTLRISAGVLKDAFAKVRYTSVKALAQVVYFADASTNGLFEITCIAQP